MQPYPPTGSYNGLCVPLEIWVDAAAVVLWTLLEIGVDAAVKDL